MSGQCPYVAPGYDDGDGSWLIVRCQLDADHGVYHVWEGDGQMFQ